MLTLLVTTLNFIYKVLECVPIMSRVQYVNYKINSLSKSLKSNIIVEPVLKCPCNERPCSVLRPLGHNVLWQFITWQFKPACFLQQLSLFKRGFSRQILLQQHSDQLLMSTMQGVIIIELQVGLCIQLLPQSGYCRSALYVPVAMATTYVDG